MSCGADQIRCGSCSDDGKDFMDDTSAQRTMRKRNVHVCIAVLVSSAAAYLTLAVLQFPHWSTLAVAATTMGLWLLPWTTAFTMLLRAHAAAGLDRKNRDTVLQDRDMLRTLIDSLPDFIYAKDVQCRFLVANRFCCDAMGTTAEQLVGKTDFDFYAPEIARNFYEDEQNVIRSGEPLLSRQEDVVDRNGRTSTILTTKVPLRDAAGRIVAIMGIGRNITARVAAEKQLMAAQAAAEAEMRERERMAIELRLAQKLESVGRLAAGLAHEINTPIQYVGDSVAFLKSSFEDLSPLFAAYREAATAHAGGAAGEGTIADLRALEAACDFEFLSMEIPKAFERTLEGTERVAGIVRAMKEFAHPDTNVQKPADINRAIGTTLTVAHSEYRYAARVETRFEPLPEVVCNLGELNQVFLNLIVNAAHAIADSGRDAGTGVIAIGTCVVGDEVQVKLSDNGCGIAQENLDKIFDPFFTTKEVGRGTGQGLAIARSIVVDKHAGRIEVSSEEGLGTQFVICVPIAGRRS
jgi:PAS domain S-box-containing protein